MDKQSLRDKKREATAHALADAAFELAQERSLDGFVVDDIAQRAGYSRRTFANHFSCKEEAVATAAVSFKGSEEVRIWIDEQRENVSPLDILYRLLKLQLTGEHLLKLRQLVELSKQSKALEPYILSAFRRLQIAAQETLNEFSPERYPAGYTHLLAGMIYGAVMPVLDGSLNVLLPGQRAADGGNAEPFDRYLDTMFGYLRNGF
ncbi:TetR/AcrR family transcriptional regulator [Paenibacillus sacheonensis]|uniref:TetR family transcriptional regulator n=1 Tax=Paenibacillus sacheonensis TaxID=742054 RepID=A0A7X5BZN8_9BACL|nr:TetR/AcrR family transcriptional regulator [Paenibacillus sacheonensis]MBM7567247.1 AcrR family transcriptional regulator [Paenibacillus sacheonensis]NBC72858.1 TetR family transcriptional regulator [Paenibacillus sacheonensis]